MRFLVIPLAIILGIIAVVDELIALVFLGEKIAFASFFFTGARQEMRVPGTWTDYVQQGFDRLDNGKYLVSVYNKEDESAAIYILENKEETLCVLKNGDGTPYLSHAGGVTHYKDWVYIATDNHTDTEGDDYCMHENCDTNLDMFLLSDVLDGDGVATQVGSITIPNRLAYASIYGDTLYAGAFYRAGSKYLTPQNHQVTTPAGDKNTALMMVYTMDETTGKPTTALPEYCYSTLSNVQGMCLTGNGNMLLSTSWGLSASHIYQYNLEKAQENVGTVTLSGTDVPLYYLDSASLMKDLRTPPMAEELVWQDGRVFILTESASMKYLFGKIMSGNRIHSYPIN